MGNKKKSLGKLIRLLLLLCCLIGAVSFVVYSSNSSDSRLKAKSLQINKKLLPGEVGISKTATPVAGMVNQWDIKLRIEAKNQFPPPATDIVLLIDTSGSMNDIIKGERVKRIDKAKTAAEIFVNKVLKDGYINRIALVTYNKKVTNYTFSDDNWSGEFVDSAHRDVLIDTIKRLEVVEGPGAGTNTQGGIKAATEVMEKAANSKRNIVLISDGVPTYSYPPTSPYNSIAGMEDFDYVGSGIVSDGYKRYQTVKTIPEDHFNYRESDLYGRGGTYYFEAREPAFVVPPEESKIRLFANHANSTIAQATIAKGKKSPLGDQLITDFYTIGLDMDAQPAEGESLIGNATMKEIASTPDHFFSTSSEDLEQILGGIGDQIVSAARKASVIDPMGAGFELVGNVSNSNASVGEVKNEGGKITWHIGTMKDPISSDPNETIMFAELTYRVNATQDVLGENLINEKGEAETNGRTTLTYLDYNNKIIEKDFVVPKVKPIIVSLEKQLFDEKNSLITNGTEAFQVSYGVDEFTQKDQFTIYSNGETHRVVHPWRANVDYSVEEFLSANQQYDTEIVINNQVTTGTNGTFKFSANVEDYTHQQIVVKNKKPLEQKTIYLNIRQSVISPHQELVIPSKGYYRAETSSGSNKLHLISDSTTKDTSAEIEENLFAKYEMVLSGNQPYNLTLNDIVPEYYRFYGYIATKDSTELKTKHLSTNSGDLNSVNEAKLDYGASNTYWVTLFITPKLGVDAMEQPEESPRPFSWSYKTNYFGN